MGVAKVSEAYSSVYFVVRQKFRTPNHTLLPCNTHIRSLDTHLHGAASETVEATTTMAAQPGLYNVGGCDERLSEMCISWSETNSYSEIPHFCPVTRIYSLGARLHGADSTTAQATTTVKATTTKAAQPGLYVVDGCGESE